MAMAQAVEDLDYGNFKGSVADPARHDAYLDVWTQMVRAQRNHSK